MLCRNSCNTSSDKFNTLKLRQDGRHFPDDIFKCIFLNENARIWLKKSLKFVPKVLINSIPALVQIMAWHLSGNKPLSEPMMLSLLMHICITWPQWIKVYISKLIAYQHNHIISSTHWMNWPSFGRWDFICNVLHILLYCYQNIIELSL